ncbi:amidase domain-containing protein [Paenibacillus spiritus]|uniref:Amidase domain-containing protein n=1 Tax=Paenibacillus spiritus TaxID=2496557 RepID=A0A5J5FVC5_9BACL|nr:amidase domain-containing protein [Paenibacillus spiritus]KAA8997150.1 amidase domain-containing protein [Paenibacillus spiritus]
MEQNQWKQALYLYVDGCNRRRVEPLVHGGGYPSGESGGRGPDAGLLSPQLSALEAERAAALAEWYRERGITPRRGETGVKVLHAAEAAGSVTAEVELHSAFYYEKGGATHREDRLERETLIFEPAGAGWRLRTVKRPVPEHLPFRLPEPVLAGGGLAADDAAAPRLPRPLLGRQVTGPDCVREVRYRREEAAAYADRWWNGGNPEYEFFEVDCTNYVSQCLFAGGAPFLYTGKRETGWWYKGRIGGQEWWSYSWAVSNSLRQYLEGERTQGLRAELVARPEELQLGDCILYDWDGDGRYQHSTVVAAFDAGGMPLVNAHTVPSRHRYWDYRDSYAWTERTTYRFFHIADYL